MNPTKDDYLDQIRGDLKAKNAPRKVLLERRKRVNAAKTDAQARKAYFDHIDEVARSDEGAK